MVHISQKLAQSEAQKKTIFSFEYYPPKTGQVRERVAELSHRLERIEC
jgi:5,10-methylenetetrahydrofolate reductase